MATIKNSELVPQKDLDAVGQLDTALKSVTEQILAVAEATEKISKALGKQSSSTKETEAEIAKLNVLEKETQRLYDERARIMTKLDPAVQKLAQQNAHLRNEMNKQNQENRQLARLNNATAGSVEELRAKVAVLTKEWANTKRGTSEYKSALKELTKAQKELKKEEFKGGIFGRNVGNYPKIISGLAGIAAGFFSIRAAIGVLKNATKTITDFEQANANLATVLGKSRSDITGLTESAKQLGASTEWSASKVTELQTELAKLGFNEGEIKSMQASILQFATAMGADLPAAAEVAGASLRAFGLDARDIERVTGVMAVGADKSALSFSDFQSSMSTISPVARSFGFTIEDTVALLGTLSDAGFDASTAATATRNILLNLADANGKLAKQIGGPVKTIPELAKALETLRDKGVSLSETLELTDTRSVAAFNTFMNGTDSLVKLRGELDNTDGALERIQKERLDTVQGSVKLLNSAWESLMLSFSGTTKPAKIAIDALTALLNTINRIIDPAGAESRDMERAYETKLSGYIKAINDAKENWGALGYTEEEALKKQYEVWDEQTENLGRKLEESAKQVEYFTEEEKANYEKWLEFQNNKGFGMLVMSEADKETSAAYHRVVSTYKDLEREYEDHLRAMDEAKLRYGGTEKTTTTTGSGLDKMYTDAELKALDRNRKKMAQEEVKAQQNMANLTIEIRNFANQRIINDSKKSYVERMNALEAYTADQKQIIKDTADYQVENLIQGLIDAENNGITTRVQAEKEAASQILYIRQVEANKTAEIDIKRTDTSKKITEDHAKEVVKGIEKRIAETTLAESKELADLAKLYSKGEIDQEDYENRKLEISRKYTKERAQIEMDALKKQLSLLPLDSEQREQLNLKIAEAEIELNRWKNEQMAQDDEKAFAKRKEKTKQYIDFVGEMMSGLLDFASTLISAQTDRELAALEKRQEAAQTSHEEETGRIERLEEAGAISTEQANARKAAADQKLRDKEKEIEAEKAEVQKRQAKYDKAIAATNSIINTAAGIVAAWVNPVTAPFIIPMIAATGAIQLATILAQPIPEYATGTDSHPGGMAVVGDGGRPEMVLYGGKYYKTPAIPTLMDLPKGAEVLPDWNKAMLSMAFNSVVEPGSRGDRQPVVNIELKQLEILQKQNIAELKAMRQSQDADRLNNQFHGFRKNNKSYRVI